MLLRLLLLVVAFVLAACETTRSGQTLLVVKPKDSIVGRVRSESPYPIQILFPAAESPEERSIGIIVSPAAERSVRLLDAYSEFAIANVEKSMDGIAVHLRYARDFRNKDFMGDVVEGRLKISGILGDKECKSIFLRQYAVHVTNNHCMSEASECRNTILNDSVRCTRVLYSNPVYDLTIFLTESNAVATNSGSGVLRSDCLRPGNKVNTLIAKDGSFKIAGTVFPCGRNIAQGDSGSPILAADQSFLGMVWGYMDLPNGKQVITYTPASYISSILEQLPRAQRLAADAGRR